VDRATATIARSTKTDVLKVTVTHEIAAAMPQSSLWATSPTLQAAVKAWDGDATAIDAQAKVVAGLRALNLDGVSYARHGLPAAPTGITVTPGP
jgi:hypothetical protein